jgi:hypothetical protein
MPSFACCRNHDCNVIYVALLDVIVYLLAPHCHGHKIISTHLHVHEASSAPHLDCIDGGFRFDMKCEAVPCLPAILAETGPYSPKLGGYSPSAML